MGSGLPSWYPRTPPRDITAIVRTDALRMTDTSTTKVTRSKQHVHRRQSNAMIIGLAPCVGCYDLKVDSSSCDVNQVRCSWELKCQGSLVERKEAILTTSHSSLAELSALRDGLTWALQRKLLHLQVNTKNSEIANFMTEGPSKTGIMAMADKMVFELLPNFHCISMSYNT